MSNKFILVILFQLPSHVFQSQHKDSERGIHNRFNQFAMLAPLHSLQGCWPGMRRFSRSKKVYRRRQTALDVNKLSTELWFVSRQGMFWSTDRYRRLAAATITFVGRPFFIYIYLSVMKEKVLLRRFHDHGLLTLTWLKQTCDKRLIDTAWVHGAWA